MNASDAATQFMGQLCLILLAVLGARWLAKKVGQPPVIGEMIAGVALGPSLLGAIAPDLHEFIFPSDGEWKTILYVFSQVGLVLYMFVIGLEFDLDGTRKNARPAISIAAAGLMVPLLIGALCGMLLLAEGGRYFTPGVSIGEASLFLGAAIATTAFPMMARMISERGIAGTRVGTLSLAAGALTDALSWILLALVVALSHGDLTIIVTAVVGGIIYVVGVLTVGRWAIRRHFATLFRTRRTLSLIMVAILILASGWYTNSVGIHAIFGGFVLGVAFPRGQATQRLIGSIEPLVKNLLLPTFFVYSGLSTEIGLLNNPVLWLVTLGIVAASVLGKGIATFGAAKLHRLDTYEALAIGSLMNARGLIELILLNIGLRAGIITPTLFTILVIMAIVTTLMTAPIFNVAARRGDWLPQPTMAASQRRTSERK